MLCCIKLLSAGYAQEVSNIKDITDQLDQKFYISLHTLTLVELLQVEL